MTDALVPAPPAQLVELGMLRAATPDQLVTTATAVANALAGVIEQKGLFVNLQGKRYVKCEGWTTCGALMGLTPHEVEVTQHEGCYTATVEFRRMQGGQAICRASAECGGKAEAMWNNRPPNARRSMALTRATSKAGRLAFSWIVTLAGYEATPAEEMEHVVEAEPAPRPKAAPKPEGSVAEMAKDFVQKMASKPREQAIEADQVRTEQIADTKLREFTYKAGEKKGTKGKLYVISLASGFEGTTFDEEVYRAASALIGGEDVKVVYRARKDRPDTYEVVRVEPASTAPLFDDDGEVAPF